MLVTLTNISKEKVYVSTIYKTMVPGEMVTFSRIIEELDSDPQLKSLITAGQVQITTAPEESDIALEELPYIGAKELAVYVAPNGDTVTLMPGMVVAAWYNTIKRASAASEALSSVQGIVTAEAAVTLNTSVQCAGAISFVTSVWESVIDEPGGLIGGLRYYLSTNPGKLTSTPPTAVGTCMTAVGRAANPNTLVLRVMNYILQ